MPTDPAAPPLRFALLEHTTDAGVHWDLLIEQSGHDTLATWRLLDDPQTSERVSAESIGRHRRIYLDYEGEISAGRGSVRRVDGGSAVWRRFSGDTGAVELLGRQLRGEFEFIRDGDSLHFRRTRPPCPAAL